MISGGIEVNKFSKICLILEAKFWDGPLLNKMQVNKSYLHNFVPTDT